MKKIVLSFALFATTLSAFAQEVKESTTLLNKINQPSIVADYNLSGEIVEGAFIKKMTDAKISKPSKATDGFKLYKGISIPEITKETIDLYVKVDDKKTSSTVYMLMSKGYDNFMKKETDSISIENGKVYLTKFMKDINAFSLNKQIDAQNETIADLEKKMKGQAKDEAGYTKDKSKVESKISANKIDIEAMKVEMEAQQKALELVKQKTATIEQMDALKKEVSKQESVTEKATKKYNNALEDAGKYKDDLKKAEDKIAESALEQTKTKNEIDGAKRKLEDLKTQLSNLK